MILLKGKTQNTGIIEFIKSAIHNVYDKQKVLKNIVAHNKEVTSKANMISINIIHFVLSINLSEIKEIKKTQKDMTPINKMNGEYSFHKAIK